MSGADWIWLAVWCGPIALGILYSIYMNCYGATGKHHLWPSDMSPPGKVWFHDGTWWTFNRRSVGRVERRFDIRSNPLDYEERVAYEYQECRTRKVYEEVEY